MKKIELDLMDWKSVEEVAEKGIRESLMTLEMHKLARDEAKLQIMKRGGKTSEDEREETKKRIDKNVTETTV